jgi:hypothetical protein
MIDKTNNFSGGRQYVLDNELAQIVTVSMALEMPLLAPAKQCWPMPLLKTWIWR